MKKLLLYFLLLLTGYGAVSQTNRIDSLKHQLTLLPMDTTRIPVLMQLVKSLEHIAPHQVLPYITQVITLAQKNQLPKQEAEALLMKGSLHANLTQADSATKVYLAASAIYEKLKDKKGIALCYVGMGYIYHQFFDKNDQSLEYYFKSVDTFKELQDESQMALVYNDIALVYLSMNNYKEALSYLNNALSIHTRTKHSRGICRVQHSFGDVFKAQKDYLQAISYYNKSLALAQQLYDYVLMAENYNSLGDVYFLMQQPRQAVPYLMRGLEIAKKIQSKYQLEAFYSKLSSAFESLKDSTKAYKYFKLATKYKDSIYSEGKNRQVEELRTKFNLENEKKEKELERERRKFEQIIFVAVVALVVLILIVVWVAFVKGRRKNRLLKEQNEEIKAQKEEILLQKELVEEQSSQLQLANAEVMRQKDEVEAQSRSLAMANVEISRQKEEVEAKSMSLENANEEIRYQTTQLAETLEDVKLMSKLGQELTASLEFESTFKRLYEYVSETMQLDCFRVMILNEKEVVLEDSYCIERGIRLKPEVITMDDSSKLSVRCVREQAEIFIENYVEEYPEFFPDSCLLPTANLPLSIIFLPLITKDRVIGVISVQSYQANAYDEFDRNVLR
ncbi:MAG: tetratricopeptide repeat protein, partial [Thermoflexibacteraceae bacterium]